MITVTWAAFAGIVSWGQTAYGAARKKSEQRYVRIVEHSAILVTGVTTLSRQVNALLQPLVYFDPTEWDQARRTQHVTELIAFGTEETIVPRLRTSRSALRSLLVNSNDADLVRTAGNILAMVDELFGGPSAAGRFDSELLSQQRKQERFRDDPDLEPMALHFETTDPREPDVANAGSFVDMVAMTVNEDLSGDLVYVEYLPAILDGLREVRIGSTEAATPEEEEEAERAVGRVRYNAERLLSPPELYPGARSGEPVEHVGMLFPWVKAMQAELGELLAVGQRAFPTLPTPAWEI